MNVIFNNIKATWKYLMQALDYSNYSLAELEDVLADIDA
ncbi:MAG: hypothetical protein ACJARF_002168 [Alteromonadaceae bacterium]|jgi:hypothetical protein|tara:strand:- start:1161 stop:1277 length:117 start_codon:yes stop_codon:yes gene_type:complete